MKQNHTQKKIGWTIILNIIITITEYIGGFMSGSLALISDAGHNLSDVLSLILGFFGEKISNKKADKRHTFGFKRFELITALINSLSLIFIGLFILYEGLLRITNPQPISINIMIGVGIIGLFGNIFSILILNKEKNNNLNMRATYIHLFYDSLSSVFVIISGTIIYFTKFYLLDIIISFFIATMIFWSGFDIFKKTFHLIMQGVPEGSNSIAAYNEIKNTKGIKNIHNFNLWGLDSNEIILSCHVCIDTTKKIKTDKLLKTINKKLKEKYNITNTSIQIENKKICGREH